jgi:SAM-dependent methyltransferase
MAYLEQTEALCLDARAVAPDAMTVECPVCGQACHEVFQIDGYEISQCKNCGHQLVGNNFCRLHADALYNDNYFFGGGAGYPDYLRLADTIIEYGKQYASVLSDHMPAGRVLDVGAASGFLLKGLVDSGWSGRGIDPNSRMTEFGHENFGLDLQCSTLEDFESEERFDLVSMIQVIGHFYDLSQAMSTLARVTKRDAYCLIEYWDRRSPTARLLGKAWHEYSPPSVLHWFAQKDLDMLLARHGFVRLAEGRPRKYVMGDHLKSFVDYKVAALTWGGWLNKATDIIPDNFRFRYPSFDLRWALYKKAGHVQETDQLNSVFRVVRAA